MEAQFYGEEHITPWARAFEWYRRFPYTVTAACGDDGKMIGFVNLFPVFKEVYEKIREGTYNDKFLTAQEIAAIDGEEPLYLFLSCVVVLPAVRETGILKELLLAAVEPYRARRVMCVITDNVTKEGCRFSERLGFRRICNTMYDSVIYEGDFDALICAAQTYREK